MLRVKYKALEEAEMKFGLSIDAILSGTSTVSETLSKVCPVSFLSKLLKLTAEQLLHVTKGVFETFAAPAFGQHFI